MRDKTPSNRLLEVQMADDLATIRRNSNIEALAPGIAMLFLLALGWFILGR